jgi:low affinity Fe/Cu permease
MRRWTRTSEAISHFLGSGKALISLVALVGAWVLWGALAGWPHAWEVVMFTVAPILTLVLVIFLQHAQNRDSQATHIKLNELLVALEEPSSDVVGAEVKADDELERLADRQQEAAGSGP